MLANETLLQKKYARIVKLYSEKYNVTIEEALDIFYNSLTYRLMREGISDMHCMSDLYIAQELNIQAKNQNKQS